MASESESFDPGDLTEMIGLSPSSAHRARDKTAIPGRLRTGDYWAVSPAPSAETIQAQMLSLRALIETHEAGFVRASSICKPTLRFALFTPLQGSTFAIDAAMLGLLVRLSASIDMDLYWVCNATHRKKCSGCGLARSTDFENLRSFVGEAINLATLKFSFLTSDLEADLARRMVARCDARGVKAYEIFDARSAPKAAKVLYSCGPLLVSTQCPSRVDKDTELQRFLDSLGKELSHLHGDTARGVLTVQIAEQGDFQGSAGFLLSTDLVRKMSERASDVRVLLLYRPMPALRTSGECLLCDYNLYPPGRGQARSYRSSIETRSG